jgi:hypothetical protein
MEGKRVRKYIIEIFLWTAWFFMLISIMFPIMNTINAGWNYQEWNDYGHTKIVIVSRNNTNTTIMSERAGDFALRFSSSPIWWAITGIILFYLFPPRRYKNVK